MKRIMIDREKCDGCLNCTLACMTAHSPGKNIHLLDLCDPSAESRNHIVQLPDKGYFPIFCRHCDEPECVKSCMSGALKKYDYSGMVLYDPEVCGSCFMCVMNCPYGVLKPDRLTGSKVIKCDFCAEEENGPSCVASCPKKAITVKEVE